jgi:hypothetical protein
VFPRTTERRFRFIQNINPNFLFLNILCVTLLYAGIYRDSLSHTRANYLKINSLSDDPLKKITAISPLITSALIHLLFADNQPFSSTRA